jgi:hypothetical protein
LVYANDVNLLGDNTHTIKKNTQTLIDASKEVGLEVNTEKTKYMLLSCHKNAGQNHDIKIANRCFMLPRQYIPISQGNIGKSPEQHGITSQNSIIFLTHLLSLI